jgi:Tol biopolymer transport system component
VKIRPDGTVQVLDFGLAKAMGAAAAASGARTESADSPTFTSPAMTALGVILGTATYMSPEQARGKPVDRRTDIWAFGCVLFEMLTGKPPFRGDDITLTLAAILKQDVDFSLLPADTPAATRRVLRRCLEKDPKKRLRWIGDARLELDDVITGDSDAAPRRLRLLHTAAFTAGGIVLGAAGVWLASIRSTSPTLAEPPDFTLRRLTELPGPEVGPDISPDGRQILFSSRAAGQWDVYLQRVGGGRAIILTPDSTADDRQAAFSPDGGQIAFRSERAGGGIFVMGATGESVRRVTTVGFDPAWSPDGKSIAYATEGIFDPYARNSESEVWIAEIATGRRRRLLRADAVQPTWSPDGRSIAFWTNKSGQRDISTVAAEGGIPVAITNDAATDWSPEWSPDGRWLYFSSDRGGQVNIWRVPVDSGGTLKAQPESVTNSLMGIGYARFAADSSRLSVMAYTDSYELSLADFDATVPRVGAATTIRSSSLGWCSPSPSADWLACTSRGAQEDVVLMRADGAETIRLTDDAAKDRNMTWSPDGTRIAFMSTRSGRWQLWSLRRDGSDLRQMTDLRTNVYEAVWSPDGRRIMTQANEINWLFDANTLATSSVRSVKLNVGGPFGAEAWSPDATLVAGAVLGPDGVSIAPAVWNLATNVVRRFDVPIAPAQDYRIVAGWLPDARHFLVPTPGGLAVIDERNGQWRRIDSPQGGSRYRLSGNGRKLMIERAVFDADVWLLELKK